MMRYHRNHVLRNALECVGAHQWIAIEFHLTAEVVEKLVSVIE